MLNAIAGNVAHLSLEASADNTTQKYEAPICILSLSQSVQVAIVRFLLDASHALSPITSVIVLRAIVFVIFGFSCLFAHLTFVRQCTIRISKHHGRESATHGIVGYASLTKH